MYLQQQAGSFFNQSFTFTPFVFPNLDRTFRTMGNTWSDDSDADADDDKFVPDRNRRPNELRMLCLHGHGANNDITELQVNFLGLKELGVSCDLLEAALEVAAHHDNFHLFSDRPFKSWFNIWWLYRFGLKGGALYRSVRRVMAVVEKFGPYDGICK